MTGDPPKPQKESVWARVGVFNSPFGTNKHSFGLNSDFHSLASN